MVILLYHLWIFENAIRKLTASSDTTITIHDSRHLANPKLHPNSIACLSQPNQRLKSLSHATARNRLSKELILQDKIQQLTPRAKDALRLQREVLAVAQSKDPIAQKFQKAMSTGRTLEKATIGTH